MGRDKQQTINESWSLNRNQSSTVSVTEETDMNEKDSLMLDKMSGIRYQ